MTMASENNALMSHPPSQALTRERREFAAKVRAARGVLGWSQAELGQRVGITQRSIHRLEQSQTDIRRSTAVAIELAFRAEGISFETGPDGGFRLVVSARCAAMG